MYLKTVFGRMLTINLCIRSDDIVQIELNRIIKATEYTKSLTFENTFV